MMPPEERRKLKDLRMKAKTGGHVSPKELRWCEAMLDEYPEEYEAVEKEMHKEVMQMMNPLYEEDK